MAAEHLERRAQTWVIAAMVVVAIYIGVEAIRALLDRSHPESSAFGFGIAAISVLVLPVLGVMKLRVAGRLGSPALRGDGVLTLAAASLAAITLVALLANSLLDWWWADPVAALVIAERPRRGGDSRRQPPSLRIATLPRGEGLLERPAARDGSSGAAAPSLPRAREARGTYPPER